MPDPAKRPTATARNLVFIVADQLRADVAYHERYPFVETPNLDRLRTEGATFHRAYCQYPVCGPSRASFLTGQYPQQTGVYTNRSMLPPEARTFGHHLHDNGFEAVAFGKTHGQNAGFHRFGEPPLLESLGTTIWGYFSGQSMTSARDESAEPQLVAGTFPGEQKDHYDFVVARQVDDFLRDRDSARRLAMFVGFHTPHPPLLPPAAFARYDPDQIDLPSDDDSTAKPPFQDVVAAPWRSMSTARKRELIALYLAQVTLVDACLGKVLDSLERHGLTEETLVVFLSDHGDELGDHGMTGKFHSFYEGSLRVPLVIRSPTPRPQEREALVELVDLVPTIYELLGVSRPADLAGRSLHPLLYEGGDRHRTHVHASLFDRSASGLGPPGTVERAVRGRMIRSDRWKLAWYSEGSGELYDLRSDPGERVNLFGDPRFQDVEHRSMLAALRHDLLHPRSPSLWGYNSFPG